MTLLWLTCAVPIGFPAAAHAQGTVLESLQRWWEFSKFDADAVGEERIGPKHHREGPGVLDETHDFGPLSLFPGENAEGRVYSNENGGTYWVSTEAPSGNVHLGESIGSGSKLRQYQYFKKTSAAARLRLKVTEATMEILDDNGGVPDKSECPWLRDGGSYDVCRGTMTASVSFSVVTFTFATQTELQVTSGAARLMGWRGNWDRKVYTSETATVPFWDAGDFDFEPDVTGNGGGRARLKLKNPVVIDVPLSAVPVGESFSLAILASANTYNRRQRESYAIAKFRDPLDLGALEFTFSGLEPLDTPAVEPPPVVPTAAPECTARPRRGAGKIQFAADGYWVPERPGEDAMIVVTRSGGARGPVSATLTTSNGTAIGGVDYTPMTVNVRFADGETGSRVVHIPILGDQAAEPDKTVNLALSDPRGCASLGRRTSAVLTLLDDDQVVDPPTYTVGGTVTGLVGTGLELREVVTGDTVSPADGPFAFSYPFSTGDTYEVRVISHPDDPLQICTLTNATGTVGAADVTSVAVNCVTPPPNGALDPTFGGDGRVIGGVQGGAVAMALQADGKIVVAGSRTLARFHADGTLDSGFGIDGQLTIVFNGSPQDAAQALAIQPDGKIVVAGITRTAATREDFAIARYNADGSLDTAFGTDGRVSTDFNGFTDRAWEVLVLPDGGLVLAGHAGKSTPLGLDNDFAAARYTSTGALDTSFDTDGRATTNVGGRTDLGYAAVLQPDGRLVLAGRVADGGADNPDVGLIRYDTNGSLDPTFGTSGIVREDLTDGYWDEAADLALQADGKLVAAVQMQVDGSFQFAAARFDTGGGLDPTFGTGGVAVTAFSTRNDYARAVTVQPDGRLVVAGQSSGLLNPDVAVARFNPDGSTDSGFDGDGKVTLDFYGSTDGGRCVAVQADGKIVVGGFARDGTSNTLALVRLMP